MEIQKVAQLAAERENWLVVQLEMMMVDLMVALMVHSKVVSMEFQ